MSSAEPIRPVGGISAESHAIGAAERIVRVRRQMREEQDEDAQDERRREDRRHDAYEAQRPGWTTRPDADPASLAGAYDDHGRAEADDARIPRRHFDASA